MPTTEREELVQAILEAKNINHNSASTRVIPPKTSRLRIENSGIRLMERFWSSADRRARSKRYANPLASLNSEKSKEKLPGR